MVGMERMREQSDGRKSDTLRPQGQRPRQVRRCSLTSKLEWLMQSMCRWCTILHEAIARESFTTPDMLALFTSTSRKGVRICSV